MKDFFKAQDFMDISPNQYTDVARMANKKLNALIESWPVVYGTKDNNGQHFHEDPNGNYNPTHKARLAFIEEIVKEPCKKHIPISKQYDEWGIEIVGTPICDNCGVPLQATWSEKK